MATDTTQPTAPEVVEPFHLIADIQPGGLAEPVLPVMWCVQPETKQKLVDNTIAAPLMLISVLNVVEAAKDADGHPTYTQMTEMDRYLMPLTQGMEYIRFSRPGKNVIKATIVWSESRETLRVLRRHLLHRDYWNGQLTIGVLDADGDFVSTIRVPRNKASDIYLRRHSHTTELSFMVPKEGYGKPSPQFEKDYFAKFFPNRPVDECKRRGRRWVLWPFFPIFLLWVSLVRLVAFAGIQLVGYRKARLRSLWHPIKMDIQHVWYEVDKKRDPIRWFKNKKGNWWPAPILVFNPYSIIVLWVILAFLANLTHQEKGKYHGDHYFFSLAWSRSLAWSIVIHAAVALTIALGIGIGIAVDFIYERVQPPVKREEHAKKRQFTKAEKQKENKQKQTEREQRERQQALVQLGDGLSKMTCDNVPEKVTLSSLPRERRTYHLVFQAAKKRVCKPFAR